MALNRALQKIILELTAADHPELVVDNELKEAYWSLYPERREEDEASFSVEEYDRFQPLRSSLAYLEGHQLIELRDWTIGNPIPSARITSKGLDFLENDGGLSAILNTVTVKFDTENLRSIIESGIIKSSLPDEQKNSLKSKLKELPASALEKLTSKMLDEFLSDPTKAIKLIANAVGFTL